MAVSDFDGDGDLDLIVNNYNAPVQYFVNEAARGHSLRVRLRGRESNRDGIGAKVGVEIDGQRQIRVVSAGDGYGSQFSRVVHFGLGDATHVDRLWVEWPSGRRQERFDVAGDRVIEVDEAANPIARSGGQGGRR